MPPTPPGRGCEEHVPQAVSFKVPTDPQIPPSQTYLKFLDTLHAALQGIKATPPAASSPPPNREAEDHAWSRRSHEVLTMTRCVGEELKATRAEVGVVKYTLICTHSGLPYFIVTFNMLVP